MENKFNLIDEPWIPVADQGRVSLKQIYSQSEYRSLGGNPVQKIAVMKLLLAIAQAANTPENNKEWKELGQVGLANNCLQYLEKWHDRFYLYGERPFLQMPAVSVARVQKYGAVLPEVSTGNTTVLSQIQIERSLVDAEKSLLLLTLMGFALSGKKTDNSVILSAGYSGKLNNKGKPSSGKHGPSVAHLGTLHSFLIGDSLHQTFWLNLLSLQQIQQINMFPAGLGLAPWEQMPVGENCEQAQQLKQSLMGRLIPLCRFTLLTEGGLHYTEGLAHSGYKEGVTDPSTAVNYSGKVPKVLWANPEKRPWRELTALLSFFGQNQSKSFQSWQIQCGLERVRDVTNKFAIWSGGLSVSSNAGEQYVSGSNDYVESQVWLESATLGQIWFTQLESEMEGLDQLSKVLYGRVIAFFKAQMMDGSKLAAQASHLFWQFCERDFQDLVNACDQNEEDTRKREQLRRRFAGYVLQTYDQYCPKDTARQLDAWAKCKPNISKYLKQEK